MRRVVALAIVVVSLVPGVVTAQEPTRICTEVIVPEGSQLEGSPLLRAAPPDGNCDVVLYVPILLVDSLMAAAIGQVARESEATESACAGLSTEESRTTSESGPADATFSLDLELSCGDLEVARGTAEEWSVVAEHGEEDQPAIEGSASRLRLDQGDIGDAFFAFTQRRRSDWTVGLPATATLSVGMILNAAAGTVDLGAGPASRVNGTFNASDITLDLGEATSTEAIQMDYTFNASSARLTLPAGPVIGGMTLNASELTICVPAAAEARIELESTMSSDDLASGGLSEVDGGWQTDGFATAATRIDLSITSTVSSLTLERTEGCPGT